MDEYNMVKPDFAVKLIEFYRDNLLSSSESVKKLAEIQKIFPAEYEDIKVIALNPTELSTILEKLDDTIRGILVNIYLKQDMLSRKGALLFQMTVEEKMQYAKELEEFSALVDSEVKKLMAIHEAKKK